MDLLRSRKVFVELYLSFLPVRKEAWVQVSLHVLRDRDSTSFQIRMSQAIYIIYV